MFVNSFYLLPNFLDFKGLFNLSYLLPICLFSRFQRYTGDAADDDDGAVVQRVGLEAVCVGAGDASSTAARCLPLLPRLRRVRAPHRLLAFVECDTRVF